MGLFEARGRRSVPGLQLLVLEKAMEGVGGSLVVHPIIESESHPTITDRLPLEYTRLDLAHGIAKVGAR
jgi:hypothetical protein